MTDEQRQLVQQRLGYRFTQPDLIDRALTHASIADSRLHSNERLEFLGDAVLGLVVCERVFALYPDLLEGEMTKIKSTVVSRQSCSTMTDSLGLTPFLALGKGMRGTARLPTSLAAAILESVVAAIYLDGGIDAARGFLLPLVEPLIHRAFESGHQENFKSILQQHAQQSHSETPVYVVLEHKGPDHAKHFFVCVQIAERRFAACWGMSKKQAEQQAARLALQELGVLASDPDGTLRLVHGPAKNADDPAEDKKQP